MAAVAERTKITVGITDADRGYPALGPYPVGGTIANGHGAVNVTQLKDFPL